MNEQQCAKNKSTTSRKPILLLSWLIFCNIVSSVCIGLFWIAQSKIKSELFKKTIILEWIGILFCFLYFMGYSFLFHLHPLNATNRTCNQLPVVPMNDLIL